MQFVIKIIYLSEHLIIKETFEIVSKNIQQNIKSHSENIFNFSFTNILEIFIVNKKINI